MSDEKESLLTFGISLPPEDVKELDRIKEIDGVSRSLLVRWAVRDYITKRRKSLFLPVSPVEMTNDISESQVTE